MGKMDTRSSRKVNYRNVEEEIKKIDMPLSEFYKDKANIFLPDRKAHEVAKKIGDIPPHQLRKILNQVKESMTEFDKKGDKGIEAAKNKLFALLPIAAYNAGRDSKLKSLYRFLVEHINEKSIVTFEDIKLFDELITSIVAYHKYEANKNKGGR